MPVCFKFEKSDGTIPTLQQIDKEMCEALAIVEDPKRYCSLYQLITWMGVGMCKAGHVTKESFDAEMATRERSPFYTEEEERIARSFLYEQYKFSAWYQGH